MSILSMRTLAESDWRRIPCGVELDDVSRTVSGIDLELQFEERRRAVE
jgi:hypothetical protein